MIVVRNILAWERDEMAYSLDNKLVVALASSALFDLSESDRVFKEKGEDEYRKYQRDNEHKTLSPGVAFPLIKRLLNLNTPGSEALVEVILFSKNDPDTGLRVFKSIQHYQLSISRAIFVTGRDPFKYMNAFNATLFLSGNKDDVKDAIGRGLPAGHVVNTANYEDDENDELRIVFDFDGVIADDSSEEIYKHSSDINEYFEHEQLHAADSMPEGPLFKFFQGISNIQKDELRKEKENPKYQSKIRIAICTARNAPALERVVTTLRKWDIRLDEAFFLGGIEKANTLEVYRPHMFFDDQQIHIKNVSDKFPSVHIPYGIANKE